MYIQRIMSYSVSLIVAYIPICSMYGIFTVIINICFKQNHKVSQANICKCAIRDQITIILGGWETPFVAPNGSPSNRESIRNNGCPKRSKSLPPFTTGQNNKFNTTSHYPYSPCMEYLPTFGSSMEKMQGFIFHIWSIWVTQP